MLEVMIVRVIGIGILLMIMFFISWYAFKQFGIEKGQRLKTFLFLLIVPLIDWFINLPFWENVNIVYFGFLTILIFCVPFILNKIEDRMEKKIIIVSAIQQLFIGIYAKRLLKVLSLNTLSRLQGWLSEPVMMILFYTVGTVVVLLVMSFFTPKKNIGVVKD